MRRLLLPLLLAGCGPGGDLVVDVVAPLEVFDAASPYEIVAVVTTPAKVTLAEVRWFTAPEGTPKPVNFIQTDASDRWLAKIPAQSFGTTIRYTVVFEDDEGRRVIAQGKDADGKPAPYELVVSPPNGVETIP